MHFTLINIYKDMNEKHATHVETWPLDVAICSMFPYFLNSCFNNNYLCIPMGWLGAGNSDFEEGFLLF